MEIKTFYYLVTMLALPILFYSPKSNGQSVPKTNHPFKNVEEISAKDEQTFCNECSKHDYTERSNSRDTFYFSDIKIEFKDTIKYRDNITFLNYSSNTSTLEETFEIGSLPGIGEMDFWYFKCPESKIFMIELDDYYSSIFLIYRYLNSQLYALFDFSILQPNVEDEGIKEKNFDVKISENSVIIIAYLDDQKYDTFNFDLKNAKQLERVE